MDNTIKDKIIQYLMSEQGYSAPTASAHAEEFMSHPDIAEEFFTALHNAEIPSPITVEGYTAQMLKSRYALSTLGAYNFLIYLREKPEDAKRCLNAEELKTEATHYYEKIIDQNSPLYDGDR